MAIEDQLRYAGDVSIDEVTLVNSEGTYQDIQGLVLSIQIFEDIFSPFITGTLIVKDSLDLLNSFKMTGNEYLRLSIRTPTLEQGQIKGSFSVYKMANREYLGDKSVIYELHFITKEAIVDMNKAISKSFNGLPSDIAKDIITNADYGLQIPEQFVNIEPSTNKLKFISNFWNPTKCLNYLCEHAINEKESPTYLFFENRAGINFVTLDALYANEDFIEQFILDNYARDNIGSGEGATDVKNIVEDYKRIQRLAIPVVHDYIDRLRGGALATKQYSFDIMSKNVNISLYDALEDFSKLKHLNMKPLVPENTTRKGVSYIVKHMRHYDNFTTFGDSSNYKWLQRRMSQLKTADSAKIEITVPGRTQYTAGQRCVVEVNRVMEIDDKTSDTEMIDATISGSYIIASINHHIDRQKHECVMELIKDSFLEIPE